MEQITDFITIILAALGGLTLIVRGLAELATLTANKKDDAVLAKLNAALAQITGFLQRVTPEPRSKQQQRQNNE